MVITTDASTLGWGAVCGSEETGGQWRQNERSFHINWLELRAVELGLQCFAGQKRNIMVKLEIDNTTAVAFVNRQGGTASQVLCNLAQRIWQWARERGLHLFAVHVPGRLNVRADFHSRHFHHSTAE